MNLPNFNPDNTTQILDKLFSKALAQSNRKDTVRESYQNRDRSFEQMLEKKALSRSEEQSQLGKKSELKTLTDNEIKKAELKTRAEAETEQSQELTNTMEELLTILEKLIHNQELSRREQSFLVKNQDLLTQASTKMGGLSPSESQIFFKQLVDELKNLTNNNNQRNFSKELLGQLESFALKLKSELQNLNLTNINSKDISQTQKLADLKSNFTSNQAPSENTAEAAKNIKTISLSGLEKLTDISGLKETNLLRSLKLEDIYIKPNNQFGVIKGNIRPQDNTNPTHQNLNPNVSPSAPTTSISTSMSASGITGNESTLTANGGMNSTAGNQNSIGAQLQRNTVVNFNSSEGTANQNQNQSGIVAREGFMSSPNGPNGIGNRMFAGQTTSQGINFRPFVEHLTGQIHRGFVAGQQVMLVKLQPENLGAVGILLRKESDNALHLKLNVDSLEVKDLIEKFGADIKTSLGKENLDLLSFDVNVNENGTNSADQKNTDDNGFGEKKFNEILANEENQILSTEKTQTVDLRLSQGVLNIKI